jgi:retron-type reverse transcriptase
MHLGRARFAGLSFSGGRSTTDACLYRWRLRQKKTRRSPPAALVGAGVWRHA